MEDRWASDAPPRFAYESDSSADSAFEDPEAGPLPSRRPQKVRKAVPVIEVDWRGESTASLLVLTSEAGESFSHHLPALQEWGSASIDGKQIASICQCRDAIVVLAATIPLDAQNTLAKQLLAVLKPQRLSCIDSYSLQSYLTTNATAEPDAVLRFLQTYPALRTSSRLQLFDVPNLVTGFTAALMTQAVYRQVPAVLLLAPSFATAPALHSSFARPRHRPQGIYDPTDANEEHLSLPHLFGALSDEERAALGWTEVQWQPGRVTGQDPWLWLRMQEKKPRGDNYDGLYL